MKICISTKLCFQQQHLKTQKYLRLSNHLYNLLLYVLVFFSVKLLCTVTLFTLCRVCFSSAWIFCKAPWWSKPSSSQWCVFYSACYSSHLYHNSSVCILWCKYKTFIRLGEEMLGWNSKLMVHEEFSDVQSKLLLHKNFSNLWHVHLASTWLLFHLCCFWE